VVVDVFVVDMIVVVVTNARGLSATVVVVARGVTGVDEVVVLTGATGVVVVVVGAINVVVVVAGTTKAVVVVVGATIVVVVVVGPTEVVVVVGATIVVVVVVGTTKAVVVVVGATIVVVVVGAAVVVVGPTEVVVVVGGNAAHVGAVMRFESNVVAPFRARRRPAMVAPVFAVIDVSARMLPTNSLPTSTVAELPTCQNTLHACAPLSSTTWLFVAVTTVDPAWKMKTAFGSPAASSDSVPVMPSDVGDEYTPDTRVIPPRSVGTRYASVGARLAASS
jgi:hypothetical protein